MARLHIESDDELPELAELLRTKATISKDTKAPVGGTKTSRSKPQGASAKDESAAVTSKQRRLQKFNGTDSLFGPFDPTSSLEQSKFQIKRDDVRSSPRKSKPVKQIRIFDDTPIDDSVAAVDESSAPEEDSFHLSEDALSDEESWLAPKKSRDSPFKRLLKSRPQSKLEVDDPSSSLSPTKATEPPNPFHGPRIAPPPAIAETATSSRPTSSYSVQDNAAILHYTPPKRISPSKKIPQSTSLTPPPELPPSPSKKLNSPTKSRFTSIPRTAVRESLDAFWSQDVVNDWNEQYSPRKMVASPRKNRFATPTSDDENAADPPSPSTSPRKSRSPRKANASPVKTKEARQMKKAWDIRKKQMAQEFLNELDRTIVEGKLTELAAGTGGVQIVWNKKLNTTAGRANWRREKMREVDDDGSALTWYKHTANIELAEKVIDDEIKLINVVAHEFCHLCNFMVNGIRDNPHGKEFKEWAKKVSRAFGSRGIEVTTKHSYDIDYKYVWECIECTLEFKRHSKSIDPTKQACGSCKGRLVQTKPPVRGNANGPNEYQAFVKENYQRLRKENPNMKHGEVMEFLGRVYREAKAKKGEKTEQEAVVVSSTIEQKEKVIIESVVKQLEVITLDD